MPKLIVDGGEATVDGREYRVDVFLDKFERLMKTLEKVT